MIQYTSEAMKYLILLCLWGQYYPLRWKKVLYCKSKVLNLMQHTFRQCSILYPTGHGRQDYQPGQNQILYHASIVRMIEYTSKAILYSHSYFPEDSIPDAKWSHRGRKDAILYTIPPRARWAASPAWTSQNAILNIHSPAENIVDLQSTMLSTELNSTGQYTRNNNRGLQVELLISMYTTSWHVYY
jgi:hypothetical protein